MGPQAALDVTGVLSVRCGESTDLQRTRVPTYLFANVGRMRFRHSVFPFL